MEMILFMGIQATGKSSFYKARFYRTHVRLNYDMLKTRRREELLLKACIEGKTKFVVDNTNLTCAERARYIPSSRNAGFKVVGYFFESRVGDALRRNSMRNEAERIPDKGILAASARLELPSRGEGFDELFFVRLNDTDGFAVEEWKDEI